MTHMHLSLLTSLLTACMLVACTTTPQQRAPMTFFVTSASMGDGANLGGLVGADAHCQQLAAAAGASNKTWRAYLSVQAVLDDKFKEVVAPVHARERIGAGPWHNAQGVLIARDVDALHSAANGINAKTALNEHGEAVSGKFHDVVTGSRMDGTAPSPLDPDLTCKNWTSNAQGAALVGHFDRASALKGPWATSWNSAHQTRGCSPAGLQELGSGGLFYCFAQ
jgi:hypothetical protein